VQEKLKPYSFLKILVLGTYIGYQWMGEKAPDVGYR
jgi:hypothetical protein